MTRENQQFHRFRTLEVCWDYLDYILTLKVVITNDVALEVVRCISTFKIQGGKSLCKRGPGEEVFLEGRGLGGASIAGRKGSWV